MVIKSKSRSMRAFCFHLFCLLTDIVGVGSFAWDKVDPCVRSLRPCLILRGGCSEACSDMTADECNERKQQNHDLLQTTNLSSTTTRTSDNTKVRMSSLDLSVETSILRGLIGTRVANVYDINARTVELRLGASCALKETQMLPMSADALHVDGCSQRISVVIESGSRIHTSRFHRSTASRPSNFAMKIRKHIRGQFLNDIRQVVSSLIPQLVRCLIFSGPGWKRQGIADDVWNGKQVNPL
eukprot:758317-Hanusia_phi.AAC.6